MESHPRLLAAALVLVAGLVLLPAADAQTERPWYRLFSRPPAAPKGKPAPPDAKRLAEMKIEIAWLSDPITFPYYLEARAVGSALEVRGYVPNRQVRDYALNLARVRSPLPVKDALKEHPSLLVTTARMSPQQLHSSAATALREALPRQHQKLQVRCGADGRVAVAGPVASWDEKLAVSNALRRLHGCTSVQNLTQVPGETATTPKQPPIVTQRPPETKGGPMLPAIVETPVKNPPPETKDGPREGRGTATTEPPTPTKAPPLTAAAAATWQKRIEQACPQAKAVRVEVVAPTELRVELTIRNDDQITTFAGPIFALVEREGYRLDLRFSVEQEKK